MNKHSLVDCAACRCQYSLDYYTECPFCNREVVVRKPDPRDAEIARLRAIMNDIKTTKRESECNTLDDWRRKAMHYECAWRDCSSYANKRAGDLTNEIESLRTQLAGRDAEIARLRALLAVFVAPGAEDGCEECGGESEYCIPECMIRKGREALEGGK